MKGIMPPAKGGHAATTSACAGWNDATFPCCYRRVWQRCPPLLGWAGPPEGSYCPLGGGWRVSARVRVVAVPLLPGTEVLGCGCLTAPAKYP